MGLIEKSMLERWEIAKIEARLDKAKSIKQQKVCCTSNITDYKAQTIDAEPVKHVHWIIIDDTEKFLAKCSVCGRVEDTRWIADFPYCHCGAKMDGGETK